VAIKRRQAQGHSLAEIQAELVGATDAALRVIAGLPEIGLPGAGAEPAAVAAAAAAAAGIPAPAPAPAAAAARNAFWAQPAGPAAPPAPDRPTSDDPGLLVGVPLDGGAVLLLPAAPDHDDIAALRAAARPLLDLLTARGLLAGPSRRSST
jgi:hypothetical protein